METTGSVPGAQVDDILFIQQLFCSRWTEKNNAFLIVTSISAIVSAAMQHSMHLVLLIHLILNEGWMEARALGNHWFSSLFQRWNHFVKSTFFFKDENNSDIIMFSWTLVFVLRVCGLSKQNVNPDHIFLLDQSQAPKGIATIFGEMK